MSVQSKTTLTVGTCNVDVLVRADATSHSHHRDKQGSVNIEIGGSATNASLGFHRLQCRSRLLTAMAPSPLNSMLSTWLVSNGIEVHCEELANTTDIGAFVAQLDAHGELQQAVSQTPVYSHRFSADILEKATDGVDVVVVDANLSEETLIAVTDVTNLKNIPTAAMTVSEDKAARVLVLKGRVQLVLTNHLEAEKLMTEIGARDAGEVAEYMECLVIVTRGERGSSAYFPNGRNERVRAPALQNLTNVLGFGDATTAGLALGVLGYNLGVQEASDRFVEGLIKDVATSSSCHATSGSITAMVTQIVEHGRRDHLTRLLLRGGFEESFARLKGPNNTMLVIDVDRFKQVNDAYGHEGGDQVLARIAQIIIASTRAEDVAGRYGGDEFVLALSNTPVHEAQTVAERIRVAVEEANLYGVTLSIGVAGIQPGEPLISVMNRADGSMYEAKNTGRNKVVMVQA